MVNGSWAATQGVQIHWNGLGGPVLATAQGPNFSVDVKVPQVAPGVYYLTATDAGGTARTSKALEVTGAATAAVPSPAVPLTHPVGQHGGSNLMLGAGLLGGGLVALFSAVALTTLGRRRASASRNR